MARRRVLGAIFPSQALGAGPLCAMCAQSVRKKNGARAGWVAECAARTSAERLQTMGASGAPAASASAVDEERRRSRERADSITPQYEPPQYELG